MNNQSKDNFFFGNISFYGDDYVLDQSFFNMGEYDDIYDKSAEAGRRIKGVSLAKCDFDNLSVIECQYGNAVIVVKDDSLSSAPAEDISNIDFSKYMGNFDGYSTSIAFSPYTDDDLEYAAGSIELTTEYMSGIYEAYYNTESTDWDAWSYEFLLYCDIDGERLYFGFYEQDGVYYIDYNSATRNIDTCEFTSGFGDVS